jgi:hypothetical protein
MLLIIIIIIQIIKLYVCLLLTDTVVERKGIEKGGGHKNTHERISIQSLH